MTAKIRVVIVDDHSVVRQGMRSFLMDVNMDVVGEAASGDEAVQLAEAQQPDVMLLDIRMKGSDGLSALPQIKTVSPGTQVIILTTYANPAYLSQAMRDGACGYLLKETELEDIVAAIETAAANSALIDRELLTKALQSDAAAAPDDHDDEPAPPPSVPATEPMTLAEPISEREYDVLRLMTQGMSNADIAEALQVSVTTVKTHVKHILRKLNVSDRTQAALLALRAGLVE
jgi:two-component system, NarL family, response regulator LiaR